MRKKELTNVIVLIYLVVVSEVVVGNSNSSGPHNSIHKPISATRQRVMINPNVTRAKDGDPIAISKSPPPIMRGRAPNHCVTSYLAVVNMQPVDDHVGDELYGDARTISDVDVHAAAVDGLEAVHDEFLL